MYRLAFVTIEYCNLRLFRPSYTASLNVWCRSNSTRTKCGMYTSLNHFIFCLPGSMFFGKCLISERRLLKCFKRLK